MSVGRYRRQGANSTSFVAALAVNAALIAVVATSAPTIFAAPERTIDGYNIPVDPPPPPPPIPEKAKVEVKTPVDTNVPIPDRKVDVALPPVDDITTTDVFLPIGDPISTGSVGGPIVEVPKPAPVLVDAAPDPRAQFQPDYPASERRTGLEGLVIVRVLIGTDGRVKMVQQVRAASAAFFEATRRQALARWRFRPATQDGIPVESWQTKTVRFMLEG